MATLVALFAPLLTAFTAFIGSRPRGAARDIRSVARSPHALSSYIPHSISAGEWRALVFFIFCVVVCAAVPRVPRPRTSTCAVCDPIGCAARVLEEARLRLASRPARCGACALRLYDLRSNASLSNSMRSRSLRFAFGFMRFRERKKNKATSHKKSDKRRRTAVRTRRLERKACSRGRTALGRFASE